MTKRKDERKELLKEDAALSGMEQIARYIQNEPQKVMYWAIGVFGALALIFGYQAYSASQAKAAAGDLYRAEKILATNIEDEKAELKFGSEQEKYEAALVELDKIIDSRSGSVKQQAIMLKIRCLGNLGRSGEIAGLYDSLISEGGELQFIGIMGQADMKFAEKQYADARAGYEKLMGSAVSEELVKFKIAQCYKEEGNTEGAKRILNEVISAHEETEAGDRPPIHFQVQSLLTELEGEDGDSES